MAEENSIEFQAPGASRADIAGAIEEEFPGQFDHEDFGGQSVFQHKGSYTSFTLGETQAMLDGATDVVRKMYLDKFASGYGFTPDFEMSCRYDKANPDLSRELEAKMINLILMASAGDVIYMAGYEKPRLWRKGGEVLLASNDNHWTLPANYAQHFESATRMEALPEEF